MPPPMFLLFVPSLAIFLLIQIMLCQKYRFQVQLEYKKAKTPHLKSNPSKTREETQTKQNKHHTLGNEPNQFTLNNLPTSAKEQLPKTEKHPSSRESISEESINHTKDSQIEPKRSSIRPKKPKVVKWEEIPQSKKYLVSLRDAEVSLDKSKELLFSDEGSRFRQAVSESHDSSTVSLRSHKPAVATKEQGPQPAISFNIDELEQSDNSDDSSLASYQIHRSERIRSRRPTVFAESYEPSKDLDDSWVYHPKSDEEKKWLKENLKNVSMFHHLADDQVATVVDAMYKQPVIEGENITKEGEKGNTFFVIQKGVYKVFVKSEEGLECLVHVYKNSGSFGELALLYNQPRAASVVAQTDGILWAVDGQTFRRIIYKITYQKRMMYENLINNVPMLQTLEPSERANLVDALEPMVFLEGQEIVRQGDKADGMYFIISGTVNVYVLDPNNIPHFLKSLSNGEYFGELGLLTQKPRAGTVVAVGRVTVAYLCRDAFERLLGPCMDIMKRNIDTYNSRMAEILEEIA